MGAIYHVYRERNFSNFNADRLAKMEHSLSQRLHVWEAPPPAVKHRLVGDAMETHLDTSVSVEASEDAKLCPKGVRVLVVDSDSTCLSIVSRMLHVCGYKVMSAKRGSDALCILRAGKDEVDLILTEIRLEDMDKYRFLETLGQISDSPVVFFSADYDENVMLGTLHKGAAFCLVKPISLSDVEKLWQFSYMKARDTMDVSEGSITFEGETIQEYASGEAVECQSTLNFEQQGAGKLIEEGLEQMNKYEEEDNGNSTVTKKPKLIWTPELHERFLHAIRILGMENAHPKKILQYMNVPGLKKENVSSHLQKYRLSLKREQDAIQQMIRGDYRSSSMCSLQKGLCQNLNPQYSMTEYQPDVGTRYEKNINCLPFVPSHSSSNFRIHLDSNHNDMFMHNHLPLGSQSKSPDSVHASSSSVEMRRTGRRQLAMASSGHTMNNNEETTFSNEPKFGRDNGGDERPSSGNSLRQQLQHPPPEEEEENYDFENLGVDIDELFGTEKWSVESSQDEDSGDLF